MKPVFIVGMPRTGSKIYKNIINAHTPINISPEIFFLTPKWIRSDFLRTAKRLVGDMTRDENIAKLSDLIFQGHFFGTYYRSIAGNKDRLTELLRQSNRSPKGLLEALLRFDAEQHMKESIGAKFPVHITRAQTLVDWYPDARFIHINRHPLAIYSSQKRKHLKNSVGALRRLVTVLSVLAATVTSYRASYKFHLRNRQRPNYIFFQYEDLVSNPDVQVRRLCDFLEVQFVPEMLNPTSKGSSYENSNANGIHAASVDRWQREIGAAERRVVTALVPRKWATQTARPIPPSPSS